MSFLTVLARALHKCLWIRFLMYLRFHSFIARLVEKDEKY